MAHLRNTLLGAAALSALTGTAVQAQDSNAAGAAPAAPAVSSAPVVGVRQVPLWPATIDPATASRAARAQYNIPPAPNAKTHPKQYQQWLTAVSGPKVQEKSVLTQTTIKNGPMQPAGSAAPSRTKNSGTGSINSYNWSGSADYLIANPTNQEAIYSYFQVPTANQALNACTGSWDYSSIWPGIDGFYASGDVLQGGVEVDALCVSGPAGAPNQTYGFYSAWVEWYPFSETRVSSPEIRPGDFVFVEVWNTSATNGYAYIYDYRNRVGVTYNLTPPSGTTLSGNTVEWVAERPGVGGGLATLTNYGSAKLYNGFAWDYGYSGTQTGYAPYYSPSSGTLYLVQMLDNSSLGISYPYYSGSIYDEVFVNYGSSR